jgi:hypothetical protein
MHVPVFKTRHVLVKVVSPTISVLSGTVTSETNEALLVQPGSLVGLGGSGVDVNSGGVGEGREDSVVTIISVAVASFSGVTTGSTKVGVDVSAEDWLPHAERIMTANSMKVMFRFPFIINLLFD